MTREEAIQELKETRTVTTEMMAPLNIQLDTFLAYSQLDQKRQEELAVLLAGYLEEVQQ